MPRDIPVRNGFLLITLDQDYCLGDIYYPYVGKENHSDGRCGIRLKFLTVIKNTVILIKKYGI